ncbi:DUF7288 family protein [Halegenticoccus tardaugens]|uniref:DUF7288 family protein n=1 Tax=Halegenticoccus tardaugens TaxID=2071624 RepID=UPI00100C0C18|nr:hypothetical protein [Halegenticoccus tardaugens]
MPRAQAHTVEAFVAALLLVGGLLFAMQSTAVTPLSASTSNQHIENQQRESASSLLATADERGDLREAVLYWNPDDERFTNASEEGYYADGGPPNRFGEALDAAFADRQIAFNVHVLYHRPDGSVSSKRMVYMGSSSDNAVSAARTVALTDDSRLSSSASDATLEAIEDDEDEEFYADDADADGKLYNLVEVRLTVWRM